MSFSSSSLPNLMLRTAAGGRGGRGEGEKTPSPRFGEERDGVAAMLTREREREMAWIGWRRIEPLFCIHCGHRIKVVVRARNHRVCASYFQKERKWEAVHSSSP